MRIIAGKHKNRVIPTLKNSSYRPTTNKLREAIFSILSSGDFIDHPPYKDANILDLFAGTGSLAFEALSRGANNVTLVDSNKDHLNLAKEFATTIGEEDNVTLLLTNALTLPKASQIYNLVFIDPPYYNNMVEKSLNNLIKNQWLQNNAIILAEVEKNKIVSFSENIHFVKEKIFGNTKLLILRYISR